MLCFVRFPPIPVKPGALDGGRKSSASSVRPGTVGSSTEVVSRRIFPCTRIKSLMSQFTFLLLLELCQRSMMDALCQTDAEFPAECLIDALPRGPCADARSEGGHSCRMGEIAPSHLSVSCGGHHLPLPLTRSAFPHYFAAIYRIQPHSPDFPSMPSLLSLGWYPPSPCPPQPGFPLTQSALLPPHRHCSTEPLAYSSPSSYAVIRWTEHLFEAVHGCTYLPWWTVIVLTTVVLRSLVTLPLAVHQNKLVVRMELLLPTLKEYQEAVLHNVVGKCRRANLPVEEANRRVRKEV